MAKPTANRRAGQVANPGGSPRPIITPTVSLTTRQPLVNVIGKPAGSPTQWPQQLLFGLFLASLFTPLVYSTTSFFGFVSERGLFFRAVVGLMAVVAAFKPGFWRAGWSWLQLSVVGFLAVIGLADVVGVDARLSFLSGFLRMEGFVGYLHLGLYALVLARAGFSAWQWNTAFMTSVGVSVLVFVVGYVSPSGWLGDGYRFVATVGQPTFLAVYWLIHIFLAGYIALTVSELPLRWRLIGFGIVTAILLWGIVLTGARSAILGLLAGGGATGLAFAGSHYRSLVSRGRLVMGSILIGVMMLAAGSYAIARYTTLLRNVPGLGRIADITGTNNTLPARQITTQIALRSVLQRPLLGWGQENYSYAFARHYDPALVAGSGTEWYDRVHCVPLEWACSAGVPGLLAYGFLWFWLLRGLLVARVETRDSESVAQVSTRATPALLGLLIAYFTFNLLNPDNLLAAQFFFLLIGFVAANQPASTATFVLPTQLTRLLAQTGWLVVTLGLAYFTLNGYQTLRRLDKQAAMTNGLERMRFLRTTYGQTQIGRYEVADAVESFAISALQQPDLPAEARQFCYEQALAVMTDQRRERPQYGRLLLRISSLHAAAGQYDKAITATREAIAIDGPKRPATFMLLGDTYLMQKNYLAAMAAFEQARQIQPRWMLPLVSQAQVAAYQRDTAQVSRLMAQLDTRALLENLPAVKQACQTAGCLAGFVNRINAIPRNELFMLNRPTFQEWVLTAYDSGNLPVVEAALRHFDEHFKAYHALFTTAEIDGLIAGTKQGIRPDKLTEIAARLPVSDGVPTW